MTEDVCYVKISQHITRPLSAVPPTRHPASCYTSGYEAFHSELTHSYCVPRTGITSGMHLVQFVTTERLTSDMPPSAALTNRLTNSTQQLKVKIFPAFYGTQRFITVLPTAHHTQLLCTADRYNIRHASRAVCHNRAADIRHSA